MSEYLAAPGAVRRGTIIRRHDVIEYFRNYVGGAHHGLAKGERNTKQTIYELVSELEQRMRVDVRDGLYFELMSIGQAVGRSSDMARLSAAIRGDISRRE
jgi:hypothetical protein